MYDREEELRNKLNKSLIEVLSIPLKDYVSTLSIDNLINLKKVLSDINNTITLRLTLTFVKVIATKFQLSEPDTIIIRKSVLGTKPNTNGYDIDLETPIDVLAEVKCNIPINNKSKYGSNQRVGIIKDLMGLKNGKTKVATRDSAFKFMVLYDRPRV
ncbi:MAG: hypothetical protein JRJ85_25565, partial [Deltaproteobacteria bacterium]|nr:hypothetical protein [Deltaproteobacteria bacterium]